MSGIALAAPKADAAAGRASIEAGSKSFAAAARLFDAATRDDASILYAWCRHLDDVADGQAGGHGFDGVTDLGERLARVDGLERDTLAALDGRPAPPLFAAFARVAARRAIPRALALEHLAGFRMDAEGARYASLDDLLLYCSRVAGVVGEMMAVVMGARAGDADTLARAHDLGLAFQLTNIARDVVDDARAGRLYLPADLLAEAGLPATPEALLDPAHRAAAHAVALRLVDAAEPYYASALVGLGRLPPRAALAVAAARAVYRAIGHRLRALGPGAWDARVVVPRADKRRLVLGAALAAGGSVARGRLRAAPPRGTLWTRAPGARAAGVAPPPPPG